MHCKENNEKNKQRTNKKCDVKWLRFNSDQEMPTKQRWHSIKLDEMPPLRDQKERSLQARRGREGNLASEVMKIEVNSQKARNSEETKLTTWNVKSGQS